MKHSTFFLIFLFVAILGTAFGETENTLEKAEALITELKFYEAMVALEPLLMSDEKSKAQEEALWIANMLCVRLMEVLDDELMEVNRQRNPGQVRYAELEKKVFLNQLGANFLYNEPAGMFVYHYGFLKRLLDLYPNSSWAPVAEYYLIQEGHPVPQDVDQTLKALNAYVEKYAKSGLAEVYMAYLDIAHLNHALWAVLKDKARAAVCKAEALRHYAKFIISGHKGTDDSDNPESALESYERLKQGKPPIYEYLIFD